MRIESIHVQGFGVLRERTLRLHGPLALFYGANEAGKSTLMGFVRAVLFGFPPRNHAAERYEPLLGGAHGGSLTLVDGQGQRVLVERYDSASTGARGRSSAGIVKVTLGDGTTGGEELLQTLLGGLSADLFRSLFAFGLGELQELRTLQSEEISGYLYSAGLGVSGSAIMEAERKLAARMDVLFKPRGRNQEINQLLKSIEEMENSLRRSKEHSAKYDQYNEEILQTDHSIDQLELDKQQIRKELDWLNQCSKAREPWLHLQQIDVELSGLPDREGFPENAVARYEALEQERDKITAELFVHTLKQKELENSIRGIQIHDEVLMHQAEREALLERTALITEGERTFMELQVELDHATQEMALLLRQMDEEWDEDTLERFPVSIALRERIREYRTRFDQVHVERERLFAEQKSLQSQQNRLQDAFQELQSELQKLKKKADSDSSWAYSASSGKEAAVLLQQITRDYERWQLLVREIEHQQQRIQDALLHRSELKWVEENKQAESSRVFKRGVWLFAGLACLIPALLLLQKQYLTAGLACVIFAGTTAVLAAQAKGKSGAKNKRRSASLTIGNQAAAEELELPLEITEKLYKSQKQQEELQQKLQLQVGALLSMHEAASMRGLYGWDFTLEWLSGQLDSWQQQMELWRQQQSEQERKMEKLADARRSLDALSRQEETTALKRNELESQGDSLRQEWEVFLRGFHLKGQLSPDAVLESLQVVEQGHQLLERKKRLLAKKAAQAEQMASFQEKVCIYLGASAAAEPILSLKRWKEQFQQQQLLLEKKRQDETLWNDGIQAGQLLEERVQLVQQRISDLLLDAQAEQGEHLRRYAREQERRSQLSLERKMVEYSIYTQANPVLRSQLDSVLEANDEEQLARLKSAQEEKLLLIEEAGNQLRDRKGRLAGEIEKLELGSEHAERLQTYEEQLASLQQLGQQFAVASFASLLFKKVREVYEREKQPGVLLRASAYFSQMTGGRYAQIRAPFGEQRLVAIRDDGKSLDTGFLSRGTAEQLYLAMRFALAEEYAGKTPLPLVMDDIFVNFDQKRMESCLTLLVEMCERHQILLFTCHPHVRDAAARIIPQHQFIAL